MARKLFCEISPLCYEISLFKCRTVRHIQNLFCKENFARQKADENLPVLWYSHKSLIRRRLGTVDQQLQENKAVNLGLAAPKVDGIQIHPGEIFSFWQLVGKTNARKGYLEGLTISCGKTNKGIGGGMCQFTNLIHWMVLHTPLEVTELHHHDQYDLFPDFGRKVPFGTGTSIMYNYLDYRFKNPTDQTVQLRVWTDEEYLCGELRGERSLEHSVHISCEEEYFSREQDDIYRNGKVYRSFYNKKTGELIKKELLRTNHARVMYELPVDQID